MRSIARRWILLVVLGLSCAFLPSASADDPLLPLPVQVGKIASIKLGETREYWVSLPDRYAVSNEKYPVVYMMDGEFNFNSGVIGGLRYHAMMGEMPEFIVVGIKNTDRSQDLFPEEVTYRDGSKAGGRADQYLDFLREELIPYIERSYRTQGFRILFGTSNTGFTTVYALLRNPDLANGYIAASATLRLPSLAARRDQMIRDFNGGRRQLILVMGEYDLPTVLSGNGELKEKIELTAPEGLVCRFEVIRSEGHVPGNALSAGLRCVFDGWKIAKPLNERTFSEIRAHVDKRRERYGVLSTLPESDLGDLGTRLLGEKKIAKAMEVLQYQVDSYPNSASARVNLGDAHRQNGNLTKAREYYEHALALEPGHAVATAKLKELR
jgi:predicted alpha/beta superfamily hydrolase